MTAAPGDPRSATDGGTAAAAAAAPGDPSSAAVAAAGVSRSAADGGDPRSTADGGGGSVRRFGFRSGPQRWQERWSGGESVLQEDGGGRGAPF